MFDRRHLSFAVAVLPLGLLSGALMSLSIDGRLGGCLGLLSDSH